MKCNYLEKIKVKYKMYFTFNSLDFSINYFSKYFVIPLDYTNI